MCHKPTNHKVELRRFISVITVDVRQPNTQNLTDIAIVSGAGIEAVPTARR